MANGPIPPPLDTVHPAQFRQLAKFVQTQAAVIDRLREDAKSAEETVKAIREQQQKGLTPRYIEDIPGKRSKFDLSVKVDFTATISNGTRASGTQTISQDGPFVWTHTSVFWQVTTASAAPTGLALRAFLPPTRLPWLIRAATAAPSASSLGVDQLDFLITVRAGGSDRNLNNANEVPAACFFREDRPDYNGISHWFERNEVVTVEVTAQTGSTAPDSGARGTLWYVLHGYKILRPIDFAEAFGW